MYTSLHYFCRFLYIITIIIIIITIMSTIVFVLCFYSSSMLYYYPTLVTSPLSTPFAFFSPILFPFSEQYVIFCHVFLLLLFLFRLPVYNVLEYNITHYAGDTKKNLIL
jgi:hypothetical protein